MASDVTERRAALRAMLVDQASSAPPAAMRRPAAHGREPGRLRMVLVTGGVAAVVIAASAVALHVTGGPRPLAGGPAASPTSSEVPTARTPSGAVTSPAPTVTTTTPSATALVTPTGWQRITRAQLHAYVSTGSQFQDDPANAAIWEAEMWRNVGCMADHGFVFDPVTWAQSRTVTPPGLTEQQAADFEVAMYGPKTDQPYDWRTAGCDGAAVHAEGQDHAN